MKWARRTWSTSYGCSPSGPPSSETQPLTPRMFDPQEKKTKKKKKKASSKTDGGGGGASASPLIPGGNPFKVDAEESTGITFEMCVREVVLGKSLRDEGDKDKLERLGRLVTLRWRMPVYR